MSTARRRGHDLLRKNPRVCVEADLCHGFIGTGESITCEYESVIGFGTAQVVTGLAAERGIALLLDHCGFANEPYDKQSLRSMTVYRISLTSATGKRRTPRREA